MIDDKKVNKAIGRFLSAELKKRGITHEMLSARLKGEGLIYSASSIAAKLSRRTFSASFYLQCLMVIGHDSVEVIEIKRIIAE